MRIADTTLLSKTGQLIVVGGGGTIETGGDIHVGAGGGFDVGTVKSHATRGNVTIDGSILLSDLEVDAMNSIVLTGAIDGAASGASKALTLKNAQDVTFQGDIGAGGKISELTLGQYHEY